MKLRNDSLVVMDRRRAAIFLMATLPAAYAAGQTTPRRSGTAEVAARVQRVHAESGERAWNAESARLLQDVIASYGAVARSPVAAERRAAGLIDAGQYAAGVTALEQLARSRDQQATAATARLARAEEWKRVGALAYLDSTARSVQAYERALEFAPDDPQILDRLAYLYARQSRNADWTRVAQRLAGMSEPEYRVRGLIHLSDVHLEANDGARAGPFAQQAIVAAHDAGLLQLEAKANAYFGASQALTRDFDEASTSLQRSLAISRANGFRYEEAEALYLEGNIHFMRGGRRRLEQADQVFAQVQAIALELDDEIGAAQVNIRRAEIARRQDRHDDSERLLREILAVFERRGVQARYGFAQQQLASTLAEQGRIDEAREMFQNSVNSARQRNLPAYEGIALITWAQVEGNRGRSAEACRLATEAQVAFQRAPGHSRQASQARLIAGVSCLSQ